MHYYIIIYHIILSSYYIINPTEQSQGLKLFNSLPYQTTFVCRDGSSPHVLSTTIPSPPPHRGDKLPLKRFTNTK